MSDLTELMRRDPFKCSRQDIEQIIKFYREKHQTYNTALTLGTKPKKAVAAPRISVDGLDI